MAAEAADHVTGTVFCCGRVVCAGTRQTIYTVPASSNPGPGRARDAAFPPLLFPANSFDMSAEAKLSTIEKVESNEPEAAAPEALKHGAETVQGHGEHGEDNAEHGEDNAEDKTADNAEANGKDLGQDSAEDPAANNTPQGQANEQKRPAVEAETAAEPQKKRARRRQYEGLPKEDPESDEEDKENVEEGENDDDDEEDNLLEIDESNIITGGRRTRGRVVDYKKAAEETGLSEDDEDDDGEFEAKDDE